MNEQITTLAESLYCLMSFSELREAATNGSESVEFTSACKLALYWKRIDIEV